MAKPIKKTTPKTSAPKKTGSQKAGSQKTGSQKAGSQKAGQPKSGEQKAGERKAGARKAAQKAGAKRIVATPSSATPSSATPANEAVLDRLHAVVMDRRTADPAHSHSARLLLRGSTKVAQKFGEEAVECLIECVAGNRSALIAESADVLYHLIVMWVSAGVEPADVWAELHRREGVSGVLEKAARSGTVTAGTTKIP